MKQTLKINKEFNGLKLIQVNNGFVVVNLNSNIHTNDWVIDYGVDTSEDKIYQSACDWVRNNKYPLFKIIFTTPNLKLEGVPVIEENIEEASKAVENLINQLYPTKEDKERNKANITLLWFSGISLYNQAQKNLFTEKDLINMYVTGTNDGYLYNQLSYDEDYEALQSLEQEQEKEVDKYINYLKQPKVEITFENEISLDGVIGIEPVKCVLIWKK